MANFNKQSNKNSAFRETLRSNPLFGIYLAEVISTKDLGRSGMIKVEIPSIGKDTEFTAQQFDCFWTSPFAGTTNVDYTSDNPIEGYETTQKSYGMWMVPPDIGNLVLVAFADNNTKYPYVISCLYSDKRQHMVPGIPGGLNFSDPSLAMPVAEKNKYDERVTHNDAVRAVAVDLAEGIVKQGLINDPVRGAGTSGARRESPSEVFGFLTPGPVDPDNSRNRLGGHQVVLDDNIESRLMRFRTAGGAQILMDDTTGITYVINKAGTAWVELNAAGDVNVYSDSSINMRAKGDFNLRADQDVNIEAGRNVNIKAAGDSSGGEYTGSSGGYNSATGDGGFVQVQATKDFSVAASENVKVTASSGELQLISGKATKSVSGSTGSAGFIVSTDGDFVVGASGSGLISASGTASLFGSGSTYVTGSTVNLNSSAGPSIGSQGFSAANNVGSSTKKAPLLTVQSFLDAALEPPEFNRANAISGQSAAAPTGGERTGTQNQIATIVTTMPTLEPWDGRSS